MKKLIPLIAISVIFMSCAGFRGSIPIVEPAKDVKPVVNSINLEYHCSLLKNLNETQKVTVIGANTELIKQRLIKNGVFQASDTSANVLNISLTESAKSWILGIPASSFITSAVSGASFTIIPTWTKIEIKIEAKFNKDSKTFSSEGSYYFISHITLLPLMPFKTISKVHVELINTLCDDLSNQIIKFLILEE